MLIEQGVITHIRRRKIDEQQPTNQLTNPFPKLEILLQRRKIFLIKCYKITIPIIFFSHFCDTLTTTNNLNNLISLFD